MNNGVENIIVLGCFHRLFGCGTRMRDVDAVYLLRHQTVKLWCSVHVGKRRSPINRPGKNAFTRVRYKQDQIHERKRLANKLGRYNAHTQYSLNV
jgi:hypothetical protein